MLVGVNVWAIDDFEKGLYLIIREPKFGGIVGWPHAVILDIGDVKGICKLNNIKPQPVICHMAKNGYSTETWENYKKRIDPATYLKVIPIKDIQSAIKRIDIFRGEHSRKYNPFFNNCEHFAYFVATGKKQSPTQQELMNLGSAGFVMSVINTITDGFS